MIEATPPYRSSAPPAGRVRPGGRADVTAKVLSWSAAAIVVIAATATAAADDDAPSPPGREETIVVSDAVAKERSDPASFTDIDSETIAWRNAGQDLSTFLGEPITAYAYSD